MDGIFSNFAKIVYIHFLQNLRSIPELTARVWWRGLVLEAQVQALERRKDDVVCGEIRNRLIRATPAARTLFYISSIKLLRHSGQYGNVLLSCKTILPVKNMKGNMPRHALTIRGMGENICWLLVQQAIGIPDAKMLSDYMSGKVALFNVCQACFAWTSMRDGCHAANGWNDYISGRRWKSLAQGSKFFSATSSSDFWLLSWLSLYLQYLRLPRLI